MRRASKLHKRIAANAKRATLAPVLPSIAPPTEITHKETELAKKLQKDRNYGREATRRLLIYQKARVDVSFRNSEIEACEKSPVYFLENYGWTYVPKRGHGLVKTLPFVPWQKQKDFLWWLVDLRSGKLKVDEGIVEKSRDVGLTWLIVAYFVWRWLFEEEWTGLVVSRTKDDVDILGDASTILEKVRIFIAALPQWLIPRGYVQSIHAAKNRIVNPENGSIIVGKGGKNAGRGGRSTEAFIDEAHFNEFAPQVDASLSENAEIKIWGSTSNGMGGTFYQKRESGTYPIFRIHWMDDPFKNHYEILKKGKKIAFGNGAPAKVPDGAAVVYPYYEARKAKFKYDPVIVAQELDISYTASIENGVIEYDWVVAAKKIKLEATGRRQLGVDVGGGGENANVAIGRVGPVVSLIERSSEKNTTRRAITLREIAEEFDAEDVTIDVVGVGLGVISSFEVMAEEAKKSEAGSLGFDVTSFNSGDTASDAEWGDDKLDGTSSEEVRSRKSKEIFLNVRAEAWWKLRRRFEKTYEHFHGICSYPEDELISIPDYPGIESELCRPLYKRSTNGNKIKIESKIDMQARGVSSPHIADALVMAFYESEALGWGQNVSKMKKPK